MKWRTIDAQVGSTNGGHFVVAALCATNGATLPLCAKYLEMNEKATRANEAKPAVVRINKASQTAKAAGVQTRT